MNLPFHGSFLDILTNDPVDEDNEINLVGSVAIYCDPRTYPTKRCLQQMPSHMSVGIGSHTKPSVGIGSHTKPARNSEARIDDEVRRFHRIIRHRGVIAFGEVGIGSFIAYKVLDLPS